MAWQAILRSNVTCVARLLQLCHIQDTTPYVLKPSFPLSVPMRFVNKMEKANPNDPLFLQWAPRREEEEVRDGFVTDPLEECQAHQSATILQKYAGRALLLVGPSCCVHCRFCFRRHTPCQENLFDVSWLRANSSIGEVILSGGDPLSLPTKTISSLLAQLEQIPHIQRIRFHTRFPVGIPERVDEPLLACLQACKKQIIFVVHINHPRELDTDVTQALSAIHRLGIPILTQTVLLKGVNDEVEPLRALFQQLGSCGFIPYYLHQLDRVQGAHHFEVPIERGKMLMDRLHAVLPGYLLPRYVQELPGEPGKTSITSS